MEWQLMLLLIFGGFLVLIFLGVPIVYSFFTVNIVALYLLLGVPGLEQLIRSIYGSLAAFVLLPITLFILMGEFMFRSNVGQKMIDAVDVWLKQLPGRLSLLAVLTGALMSSLSGASIGSTAMLGSTLVPEMRKRGYSKAMSVGPILGSGGLSIMIPPSALAVVLAVVARVSVGETLIAIIVPGVLLAVMYLVYVIVRAYLRPHEAPSYEVRFVSLRDRVILAVKHILPLSLILFLVIGTMFLGIATPTEAAALGAVGALILALLSGSLSLGRFKLAVTSTGRVAVMVLVLLAGAQAFSQVIALTGAHGGIGEMVRNVALPPLGVIVLILAIIMVLGLFITGIPLMLITIPVFMPIVLELGFNPIWFGVLVLLAVEIAQTTPPYGVLLFVMKGVTPPDITLGDIIRAAVPYILIDTLAMAILIAIPSLVLWLPGLMST